MCYSYSVIVDIQPHKTANISPQSFKGVKLLSHFLGLKTPSSFKKDFHQVSRGSVDFAAQFVLLILNKARPSVDDEHLTHQNALQ